MSKISNKSYLILGMVVFLWISMPLKSFAGVEISESGHTGKPEQNENRDSGILLNFREASLNSILTYLSEAAGFAVVLETPVEGRITLISRRPLGEAEVIGLLNAALKERGYAAVTIGRTLKIVPITEAKRRSIPVYSGNDPEAIENTDRIITQIIPVRHLNAAQLRQDIAPLLPPYAELAANVSSNTLILTDTGANIRRIVEIVRAMDTTVAAVAEIRVFPLTYANASNAAKLINEMFKIEQPAPQAAQQVARGIARFVSRERTAEQPPSAEETQRTVRVIASADDRTNTLVVSGPSDVLDVIEGVVAKLDSSPAEEQAVMVYNLRNAKAKNLETVLNNLFRSTTATTTAAQAAAQRQTRAPRPATQETTLESARGLEGQVYVVADEDTNSLMIMTASNNFARVSEIIADLDRPVPQVLIKALVAEVTHDEIIDIGTEFSILNLQNTDIFSDFGVINQATGLGIRYLEGDVSVALAALQKTGKLDILSRPYILGSDNQPAEITVGQRVPFITATRMTETGQTINTIQYQDVGIILRVTPHINPDGLVILDVTPEISALTGTTVPISETVNAPVYAKRSATSRVAIQDGQTIVIGGLMEDRKTEELKKIPLLGDIPLIGALFRRKTAQSMKTELLIFLTPQVASEPEMLEWISSEELGKSRVMPSAIKPGIFEQYMKDMEPAGKNQ